MAQWRIICLAVAAFFAVLGINYAAPDLSKLREQLKLATDDDDKLAQIELLRRIVKAAPSDSDARKLLIELWLEIEDYDMAEATLKDWPDAPPALSALSRAEIFRYRDKDVSAAIHTLREYLATSPSDIDANEALVSALLTTEDAQAQIDALDNLIKLKRDATHLIQRANARLNVGDYQGAVADAQAAQALEPDSNIVKNNLPTFERLAEALEKLPELDAALQKDPKNVSKLIERAWWLRYGSHLSRSLADADAALAIAPDSLAARITRVRVLYRLDQVKSEEILHQESINVTRTHSLDAILNIVAADLELAKNPKDAAQLRVRARALNAAEQYLLAQQNAEAALALNPKDAAAGLELLYAATQLGQEPSSTLRRIEKMDASKAQLALATGYVADHFFRHSNYPVALQFAEQSLGQKETEYVLRIKAASLQRLGRPKEAIEVTRRADALHR